MGEDFDDIDDPVAQQEILITVIVPLRLPGHGKASGTPFNPLDAQLLGCSGSNCR